MHNNVLTSQCTSPKLIAYIRRLLILYCAHPVYSRLVHGHIMQVLAAHTPYSHVSHYTMYILNEQASPAQITVQRQR